MADIGKPLPLCCSARCIEDPWTGERIMLDRETGTCDGRWGATVDGRRGCAVAWLQETLERGEVQGVCTFAPWGDEGGLNQLATMVVREKVLMATGLLRTSSGDSVARGTTAFMREVGCAYIGTNQRASASNCMAQRGGVQSYSARSRPRSGWSRRHSEACMMTGVLYFRLVLPSGSA